MLILPDVAFRYLLAVERRRVRRVGVELDVRRHDVLRRERLARHDALAVKVGAMRGGALERKRLRGAVALPAVVELM